MSVCIYCRPSIFRDEEKAFLHAITLLEVMPLPIFPSVLQEVCDGYVHGLHPQREARRRGNQDRQADQACVRQVLAGERMTDSFSLIMSHRLRSVRVC